MGQDSWNTAGGGDPQDLRTLRKRKGQGSQLAGSSEVQDKVRS